MFVWKSTYIKEVEDNVRYKLKVVQLLLTVKTLTTELAIWKPKRGKKGRFAKK